MCGIAGMTGSPDVALINQMLDAQAHRGPDGRQVWRAADASVALGHIRLSIVDLDHGAQPLSNEDGTVWAVVNGEIYNHQDLRRRLSHHKFRTNSDSEVVVHLFEEMGPAAIAALDGMFAIALWSSESGLLLARDPLGIKPLYYLDDSEGQMVFASELKALVGRVGTIRAVPPGTWWMPGVSEPVSYWTQPTYKDQVLLSEMAAERIDEVLRRAVAKRLMADVPVGVFLSGGLDSSLIAAYVQQLTSGRVCSFAIGLAGSPDLIAARQVADFLGTEHYERILRPEEIIAAIPMVVQQLESCDPALVRSAIPTYFVSELAAQHVKVVLSGEGADELFAGYHYLRPLAAEPGALQGELCQIIDALHHTNLQRLDRMTMAHGLEGRVPFLDPELVSLAARIPAALKWRGEVGKWILRNVAAPYLPEEIVWRKKEKFAVGTGIGDVLASHAESVISETQLGSKEEELYWQAFRRRFGRPDVLGLMGHSRSLNPGQSWQSGLTIEPV